MHHVEVILILLLKEHVFSENIHSDIVNMIMTSQKTIKEIEFI